MKNLAKLTALTLTAALALTACGSTADSAAPAESMADTAATEETGGDLLSQIQANGTITVAMEGTWAPWTYHDESDNLVGYDVEVATKIAEKLGVEPKFVEGEWDGLLAGLDQICMQGRRAVVGDEWGVLQLLQMDGRTLCKGRS